MEFIVFVETTDVLARIIFSALGPQKRLTPTDAWPELPRATWGAKDKEVLDLRLLARAVWPEIPDLQGLCANTGLPLADPDPWTRAEALGKLVLLALAEVQRWPAQARQALARVFPSTWALPAFRPRPLPRPPRTLAEAFHRLTKVGLSPRSAQWEYAQRVAQALNSNEVVLLEAGPGTGKTFGYLIPLLLALRNTSTRAVVATRTRTLQDQLWKKDLPWLEEHLGLRVERALLKGRENYLCLRRVQELEHQLIPEDIVAPLHVLAARSGDLDELGFLSEPWLIEGLRDRPWRCQGQRCRLWPHCPSRRAREAAHSAQLVVVNHALLGADWATENALLGPYDYLVVDEAHALASVLRESLGTELTPDVLPLILSEVRRVDIDPQRIHEINALEEEIRASHRDFWETVRGLIPSGRSRLKPEIANALLIAAEPLFHAIDALVRKLKAEAKEGEGDELINSLAGYRGDLFRILSPGPGEWVQWSNREEGVSLGVTPLDISLELAQDFWPRVRAGILTSATLAVQGNPQFLLSRLGLPGETPFASWLSPFSYECVRIAILDNVPEPDDPRYPQALAELLHHVAQKVAVKGMVLFTAKRALAAVRMHLKVPHLAQGWDGERDQLLRRFKSMPPPAFLLGLESFWEGVDLPGRELEILVIARLPFPHPAEPLLEAEAEKLRAQGRSDFRELSLPLAVLKLRQGLGRLVRTPTDRGVILIADPRLTSRPYRNAFLSALPIAPDTIHSLAELDVVLHAVFR
ncbi:MAG: ATP-dependent DNA helicase [Candidatus Bipolaricaulota bacterium]|nr:ATP-dependent DNA helicase [Candidatus Bipolaricaulota bacterium]MDW8126212.1 ATP-dependent DNA helicase [Candidatus Bipolaricaulota bacterium]